jgi:hypothetical protein
MEFTSKELMVPVSMGSANSQRQKVKMERGSRMSRWKCIVTSSEVTMHHIIRRAGVPFVIRSVLQMRKGRGRS